MYHEERDVKMMMHGCHGAAALALSGRELASSPTELRLCIFLVVIRPCDSLIFSV